MHPASVVSIDAVRAARDVRDDVLSQIRRIREFADAIGERYGDDAKVIECPGRGGRALVLIDGTPQSVDMATLDVIPRPCRHCGAAPATWNERLCTDCASLAPDELRAYQRSGRHPRLRAAAASEAAR